MLRGYYILKEGQPVPVTDVIEWAKWNQFNDRHVADETIGDIRISTVFLGLDHRFFDVGPPILWETMIFGGDHDMYMDRYHSIEQAIEGHKQAVEMVKSSLTK